MYRNVSQLINSLFFLLSSVISVTFVASVAMVTCVTISGGHVVVYAAILLLP
jgi:hypothetical protein